ncbi:MAG: adenylate kinase [Actinobacteria bacterium]|jgi:adenylate kinase|nr:adenylate kinase [Micrococcales bacterium]MCB0902824.1 adenylate kinase [Actinomycetota bacterium]MCO5300065.1 adenylate kinase [Candidatus Nanopelagicales bacterium]MCB9429162.1 adenylate kinase [Actinomycetota bacterium]HPE12063.1 adenylate kinase [Actinomycetota bacterium]
MRIVLMGPPGAGKGTQAIKVAEKLQVPHISTGEIFRANLADGTPLGLEAKRYMEAGEYVPDEVTNSMVASRLAESDAAGGFILDGYPRTVAQVGELDTILAGLGTPLDKVVEITANTDEVVARLLNRAQEQGRADDTEEVIRRRMDVYAEQTEPLVRVYSERGLLLKVDGMGSMDEVTARLLTALGA